VIIVKRGGRRGGEEERRRGGEEEKGAATERKAAVGDTLEFTMRSGTASRCWDLFVVLSLHFPFTDANRIVTDTPELQKSTITGKHTSMRESARHEGQEPPRAQ